MQISVHTKGWLEDEVYLALLFTCRVLKIFSGIQSFLSKMSDCIKFQKHVPFNYMVSLKLDFVFFVYCKEQ